MLGAALLEPETYQEAALVPSLGRQVAAVAVISSIAAGVGSIGAGIVGLVAGTIVALLGWGAFSAVAYWTATAKYGVPRTATTWSATWRVLALASVPRTFLVLTLVPAIGFLVGLAVYSWVLITAVFALRTTLDLDLRPAVTAALGGVIPMLALWALAFVLL